MKGRELPAAEKIELRLLGSCQLTFNFACPAPPPPDLCHPAVDDG
jgi:hypothetical protein